MQGPRAPKAAARSLAGVSGKVKGRQHRGDNMGAGQ